MLMRILLGLVIAALGVLMTVKTRWIEDMLGPVQWAEEHIGGTNFFYKLLGIVITMLGMIVMLNLFDIIIGGFVRSIF